MSVHDQSGSFTQNQHTTAAWFDALVTETSALDQAGVHAALLSIRLRDANERRLGQLKTLLGRLLSSTDRFQQTSDSSFSVLLAPQDDLYETVNEVRDIAEALDRSGILASTGFAHRRAGESLLDTWARAEAQLDRAAYRLEHQNGLML